MSMTATLDQQIDYMERQVRHHKKALLVQVEAGRLTAERASHILACASSALQTLTQLRGLANAGEAA